MAGRMACASLSFRKNVKAAAVRFLNENAFATPSWALKPEICDVSSRQVRWLE